MSKMIRTIELDAKNWTNAPDFYSALLAALGAPKGHGRNLNALIDSMVWGGMNLVEPPCTIRILQTQGLSKDVRDEIEMVKDAIAQARRDFRLRRGSDIEIYFEAYF
jgi:RNAse (barnase) inhibitor barstar